MQDRSGQSPNNGLTYAFLKSATIIIGADLSADGTVASGDDSLNQFEVRQVGSGYSFSFNPIELNGPFLATGSGATCPTCSAAYNTKAPRAGYGEDFDGVVSSFRVAFADSGRSFISFASVIHEPSTWALMLAGFGMVGYSLRRRRAAIAFA